MNLYPLHLWYVIQSIAYIIYREAETIIYTFSNYNKKEPALYAPAHIKQYSM